MAGTDSDYARRGQVGVLVPRENPIVEPELSILLGPDVAMLSARMKSRAPSMNARLIDYGRTLARWMEEFGSAELDAVAFACTGTSYLAPDAVPNSWTHGNRREIPLISAAGAIEALLRARKFRRIALASPYPADLTERACAYWSNRGFRIVSITGVAPVRDALHPIYALRGAAVSVAITEALAGQPDAVVALGTGAPSLAAIASLSGDTPVISSNFCLGWAFARTLHGEADAEMLLEKNAAWQKRLRARFPSAIFGVGGQQDE